MAIGQRKPGTCRNIYEMTALSKSSEIIETALPVIAQAVVREMQAKACSILLLTPDHKHLLHAASYGLSESYIRKGPLSADRSISEALKGEPVAVLDATQDERVQYQEEARKEGIASILSVPILLRNEIIGVMRVYTSRPHRFTESDIHFTSVAANIGAVALEKAVLHESELIDYPTFRQQLLEVEWARWQQ